jgi:glutathione S-transferase
MKKDPQMIKIVSFKICPFVQRVTGLLEAKDIPYKVEFISLRAKPQWFLDISPNGQVPVLITENGISLFESEAIVEFINDAYPTDANVSPETRADERAWGYLGAKNYLVQCSAMRSASSEELAARTEKLGAAFAKIDHRLTGDTLFFNSATVGWVDIAWLPLLHRAAIIERATGHDFLGGRPKLKSWQAAVLETGLGDASVAADFNDAFANFYLSDQTFLGRGCDVTAPCDDGCSTGSCC